MLLHSCGRKSFLEWFRVRRDFPPACCRRCCDCVFPFEMFYSRRAIDVVHVPRSEIEAYFRKHSTSPMTGIRLPFKALVRNNQLRNVIDAWRRDESTSGKWRLLALEELKCPITMSLMHDAVVTCDGHSYERGSIIQWLRRHSTSPKSNVSLGSKALVTNRALAQMSRVLCSSQHQSGVGAGQEIDSTAIR